MSASSSFRRSRPTAAHLTEFYFAVTRIEQDDQLVLEKWIDELWSEEEKRSKRSDKDAGPEHCRQIIGMSKLVADGTFQR